MSTGESWLIAIVIAIFLAGKLIGAVADAISHAKRRDGVGEKEK